MTSRPEVRTIGDIAALLAEAMEGGLRLEDVKARWPTVPRTEALKRLREDLLFALEHIPVDKNGETIGSDWRGTPDFDDLKFYARQLERLEPGTPIA